MNTNKYQISNWYNLLLSLLLLGLCVLCVTEIGIKYSFIGGGRSSIETRLEHSYRFYNRSTLSLLGALSISFLSFFFFGRFINKNRTFLNWKHTFSILPFTGIFFLVFVYNYNNPLFECHLKYFIALGLNISVVLLLLFLSLKTAPPPLDDILDQP